MQLKDTHLNHIHSPDALKTARIDDVIAWATKNLSTKINTQVLAEKAYVSRSTFERSFRQTQNMSPREWLIKVRLIKAQNLLASTSQSIDSIAKACGYVSALSLRLAFKKHLDQTPGEYRLLQQA
ncbi:hypothetical protein C2869_05575 [Saccharobesus litoralis]|uniref:HTH araC/xylS-type domain-containing protein n=1 Tax=Saccharobesus litoralis TaxID=2172099 RepID=A0A2S0VP14_9ALTE|nr:helix-turn-helix domain-containing protein [Saccharobesus litoralis]AWB65944.1 hypothetical protein C2869_05575 [Saccharobesus litoralis]